MAMNPQLFPNGMPVPFMNEMFVLIRDGVEFDIDKIPGTQGGRVKVKGTIYLSNIRIVFVASKPVGNLYAFDMPLESVLPLESKKAQVAGSSLGSWTASFLNLKLQNIQYQLWAFKLDYGPFNTTCPSAVYHIPNLPNWGLRELIPAMPSQSSTC